MTFNIEKQWMTNWCWAASTVSICAYYGHPGPFTQQQFAANALQTAICAGGPPNAYCNKMFDFGQALQMVGHLQQDPILGTISSTALVGYLQQYGPVGCQLSIPDLGGHAVVVTNAQSVPSGETYVWVADPMDGQIVPMPYAQLCSNFRGHGGQWIRTYITS